MTWIDSSTALYGIIGKNISYSLSPVIHNYAFRKVNHNAVYLRFDVSEHLFETAFMGLASVSKGLNVTIPYKERALGLLEGLDSIAEKIGAVNTVKSRVGFNTDYLAIKSLVVKKIGSLSNDICLIYGAGGAARAASFSLGWLGCKVFLINRTKGRAKKLAEDLSRNGIDAEVLDGCRDRTDVVVNATPNIRIISNKCLPSSLIIDFTYGSRENDLLKRAKQEGVLFIDGISILIRQAIEAQKIWIGIELEEEEIMHYLVKKGYINAW